MNGGDKVKIQFFEIILKLNITKNHPEYFSKVFFKEYSGWLETKVKL